MANGTMTTTTPGLAANVPSPLRTPTSGELLSGDVFSNPAVYEHVKNVAGLLANGAFTPKHLIRENPSRTLATCVRVVIQALRWGFDPFAVADETYDVHGRLGYQGKLVIAVVNARGHLKGNLNFTYKGSGDNLTVTVIGTFAAESEPRTITLSVGQAKTENKMWKTDPEQKLAYSGAIKWARRHCPELMAGVRTVEDLEAIAEREDAGGLSPEETTALLTSPDESASEAAGEVIAEQTPAKGKGKGKLQPILDAMDIAADAVKLSELQKTGKDIAVSGNDADLVDESFERNMQRVSQ